MLGRRWTVCFAFCAVLIYLVLYRQTNIPKARFGELQIDQPSQAPLHFFAVGDTGTGEKDQYAIAAAMEKRCQELGHIDGLMLLGDLFYMEGVKSVHDPQWAQNIIKPYGTPCLKKANIYPIFGNHDYRGNKEAFIEYSQIDSRWKMPHRFYSVNFGELVKFIGIDSNFSDFCFLSQHCVIDFLRSELSQKAKWKIVMAHHPLENSSAAGYSHSGTTLLGKLFRWLSCSKADLWLSGHSHHLEHRKINSCSTELIVAGGGGGELQDVVKGKEGTAFVSSQFGFLELEISPELLLFQFLDENLKVLYKGQKENKKLNLPLETK